MLIGERGVADQTFTITVLEIPIPPYQKPQCTITSPANNSKVSGRVLVRGAAQNGTFPLTIVQIRIDGGAWQTAVGLGNWSQSFNFAKITSGRHAVEARSFDGTQYSNTASVRLDVQNPEQKVTVEPTPWCFALLIILAVAGVGAYLILGRKDR